MSIGLCRIDDGAVLGKLCLQGGEVPAVMLVKQLVRTGKKFLAVQDVLAFLVDQVRDLSAFEREVVRGLLDRFCDRFEGRFAGVRVFAVSRGERRVAPVEKHGHSGFPFREIAQAWFGGRNVEVVRRLPSLLVVLVAGLLAPAAAIADYGRQTTTLLAPSGEPVGGLWQQWMNDSYMPTYSGPMVLDLHMTSVCGFDQGVDDTYTTACTAATPFEPVSAATADAPETGVNMPAELADIAGAADISDTRRFLLLYEQGHVIDFRYLTDAERAMLISLWRRPGLPAGESMNDYWWAGESDPLAQPLIEWFAEDYAICATVRTFNSNTAGALGWGFWFAHYPLIGHAARPWSWAAQSESCGLIRYWIRAATGSTAGT